MFIPEFKMKYPTMLQVVPSGWYETVVTRVSCDENLCGTGLLVCVSLTITKGDYTSAVLSTSFIVKSNFSFIEETGQQKMSNFAWACGFEEIKISPRDYEDLVLGARVKKIVNPDGTMSNFVIDFRKARAR